MSSEAYRKVGRGGAGNFWSQRDVADATATAEAEAQAAVKPAEDADLEAQNGGARSPPPHASAAGDATSSSPSSSTPAYARGGRGGAGNFYEPSLGDSIERDDEARRAQAAAGASAAQPQVRYSGRGGAGNWSTDASGTTAAAVAAERQKKSRLEAKVLQDVDAGLAPPPKTYHQHDRDLQ